MFLVQLLGLLGIIIVGLTLWRDKDRQARQKEELKEFKNIRDDLLKARKDVENLLEQLEKTSEKIVGEITSKLEEMEDLEEINELEKKRKKEEKKQEIIPQNLRNEDIIQNEEKNEIIHKQDALKVTAAPSKSKAIPFPTDKRSSNNLSRNSNNKDIRMRNGNSNDDAKENGISPKQQMVYAMDKLGCSEEEIAKQTNMGKGEVRLILELKRKGEEHNA